MQCVSQGNEQKKKEFAWVQQVLGWSSLPAVVAKDGIPVLYTPKAFNVIALCVSVSELELRQQRDSPLKDALLLTVQDRQEPLGSGGATLNALLVAAEHLSNRAGHTVSDEAATDWLTDWLNHWLTDRLDYPALYPLKQCWADLH